MPDVIKLLATVLLRSAYHHQCYLQWPTASYLVSYHKILHLLGDGFIDENAQLYAHS